MESRGKYRTFDEAEGLAADALYTAINTTFAFSLLDKAIEHWTRWRSHVNPSAKMLVVASDISAAKTYLAHINASGHKAAIATSEESAEAQKNIARFRDQAKPGILVTVAMAYEGLDVPAATHVACLTHIRSYPWIDQMLARVTRFDPKAGDWESQYAFAFVPDDPAMREIIEQIRQEQLIVANSRRDAGEISEQCHAQELARTVADIVPHSSACVGERASLLDGCQIPQDESKIIRQAMRNAGITLPVDFAKRFLEEHARRSAGSETGCHERMPNTTSSMRESALRSKIQKRCNQMDYELSLDHGEMIRRILNEFGKPRDQMSETELGRVWAWLHR